MVKTIDAAVFQRMVIHGAAAINAQKQPINDLNVFPVRDGDTGTNMSLTISAAAAEMKKKRYDTVGQAAQGTASALLRGARGNSGVILSLLFRGISKALNGAENCDGVLWAQALQSGVDAAVSEAREDARREQQEIADSLNARVDQQAAANDRVQDSVASMQWVCWALVAILVFVLILLVGLFYYIHGLHKRLDATK